MSGQYMHHLTSGTDVEIVPGDSVTIFDSQDNEVVKWIVDEWKEDPNSITSTVNAVLIAARYGGDAVDTIVNGEKPMEASRKDEYYRRRRADILSALADIQEQSPDIQAVERVVDRAEGLLEYIRSKN